MIEYEYIRLSTTDAIKAKEIPSPLYYFTTSDGWTEDTDHNNIILARNYCKRKVINHEFKYAGMILSRPGHKLCTLTIFDNSTNETLYQISNDHSTLKESYIEDSIKINKWKVYYSWELNPGYIEALKEQLNPKLKKEVKRNADRKKGPNLTRTPK